MRGFWIGAWTIVIVIVLAISGLFMSGYLSQAQTDALLANLSDGTVWVMTHLMQALALPVILGGAFVLVFHGWRTAIRIALAGALFAGIAGLMKMGAWPGIEQHGNDLMRIGQEILARLWTLTQR